MTTRYCNGSFQAAAHILANSPYKNLMGKHLIFLAGLLLMFFHARAQEKCGTAALEEKYRPLLGESVEQFEQWVQNKKVERRLSNYATLSTSRLAATVYTIPVVVHVLHQGEEYGVGSNIPDEQIFSQLETLNQDFRRLNADTTETRDDFKAVAADTEIEFVLAMRDPEGLPTNGIVRTRAGQESYQLGEEVKLGAISYWDPDKYLNIWVTNLTSGLLGYAQFPVGDFLGLQQHVTNSLYPDGVTVDYEFFGVGYNTNDFSRGRTATHEIGHYFGLRHIWGDGGCNTDDYLEDTPSQDGASSSASCQLTKATCNSLDMIENYMDYSPDVCMNIFTEDQKERMRTVLEYSPRRRSLLSSDAALPPVSVAKDLGIRSIYQPQEGVCNARFTPEVEVRNYGSSPIQQFQVRMLVNDVVWDAKTISAPLGPLATYTVAFDELLLTESGSYHTTVKITSVDGSADQNNANDSKTVNAVYQRAAILPLLENFDALPLQFVSKTAENVQPFSSVALAPKEFASNEAIKFDYFSSDSTLFGAWEVMLSPVIDMVKYPAVTINFDYAYGHNGSSNVDGLIVAISTDCGNTFTSNGVIFKRFGASLATTFVEDDEEFIPSGPSEWRSVQIPVTGFQGASKIQIAFIAQNGLGNNLYLDDIRISSNSLADYDIGISEVINMPFLTCLKNIQPTVVVKNFGKQTVTDFTVYYSAGNIEGEVIVTNNLHLLTGQSVEVPLQLPSLDDGDYNLSLSLEKPNGNADERISDNSWSSVLHVRSATDVLPLRETFSSNRNSNELTLYRLTNADNRTWQLQDDHSLSAANRVVRMTSYDLTALGDEFWLASPVLNMSGLNEASLVFKVSYAKRVNRSERLRVMVSTDCGTHFQDIVYDKRGSELAVAESDEFWVPQSTADWRTEFVDLSAYAGRSNVVVAIVGTNGNGNNLYLDDIEFFLSGDEIPVIPTEDIIRVFPNPAKEVIKVAFNLPQRETATLRFVDVNGKVYFEKDYPNTLNQTYELTTISENAGVYFIQVITPSRSSVQRVILRH